MQPQALLTEVLRLARQLSPVEKVRLIEQIAPDVEAALASASGPPPRRRGLRGLLRGCGITAEDIEAARREQWQNFPHADL